MDPEIVERLNEQFREMSDILSQQNASMAAQIKAMQDHAKAMNQDSNATKNSTTANKEQTNTTNELNRKQLAYMQSEEQRQAVVEATMRKFNSALQFSTGMFQELSSAVMNSTQSFQKYNGAIGMVGDSALDLGRNFGVLGTVLGGVVKASTMLVQYQLEQKDNLLRFNDELSKMGAMNAFSTNELLGLANSAGFAARDIDKILGPMQRLGSTFKQIGSGAEDSTKRFMDMVTVGSDVRQEFQRLGYSQAQLVEAQTGYIELMGTAGLSLRSFSGDMRSLQRTSLDYVKNLQILSELSGQSAEAQQQQMSAAAADMQFQLYTADMNRRIAEAATTQEKERLEQQYTLALATKAMITRTQGEEAGRGFGQLLAGGPMTQGLEVTAITGTYDELQSLARAVREGTMTEQQLARSQTEIQERLGQTINGPLRQALIVSEDAAKLVGGLSSVSEYNRLYGLPAEQLAAAALGRTEANEEGTGASAEDDLQQARNALTESEIRLRTGFDALAGKIGITGTALIGLAGAAGVAGLAIASRGALGRLGSIFSRAAPTAGAALAGTAEVGALAGTATTGAAAGASRLAGLGGLARGGARLLGKLAWPLAAGMALYDSYQGFNADTNASFGSKLMNAGSSALSGLTFGLLGSSADEIRARSQAGANDQQEQTVNQEESFIRSENSFARSVAAFGRLVALSARLVTSNAKLTKAFATSVKNFSTAIRPLTNLSRVSFGRTTRPGAVSSTLTGTEEELDLVDYIENLKTSLYQTTVGLDNMREAEVKRHNFNEMSMRQFRLSLDEASKKLDLITGRRSFEDNGGGGGGGGGSGGGLTPNSTVLDAIAQAEGTRGYNTSLGFGRYLPGGQEHNLTQMTLQQVRELGEYMRRQPGNPNSSALGRYQILATSTMLDAARALGMDLETTRFDEETQDRMAMWIANTQGLQAWEGFRRNPELRNQAQAALDSQQERQNSTSNANDAGLVALGRQLQSQGLTISGHSAFNPDGKRTTRGHSNNSRHYRDLAIDINAPGGIVEADHPEWGPRFDRLAAELEASGFSVLWRTSGHDNHIHASVGPPEGPRVRAAQGGIFDGPSSGYPAELHGGEMVAPLDTNSILMKLAKTPSDVQPVTGVTAPTQTVEREIVERLASANTEMLDVMVRKLDNMIDAIQNGNDTRDKIFKNSRV